MLDELIAVLVVDLVAMPMALAATAGRVASKVAITPLKPSLECAFTAAPSDTRSS